MCYSSTANKILNTDVSDGVYVQFALLRANYNVNLMFSEPCIIVIVE